MSGELSGLQSRFGAVEPRALFVHCRGHNLNLVVQDEVKNNQAIENVMSLVQKFIAFARGSPKRLAWFNQLKNEVQTPDGNHGTSFRPFCPTRWIMRKPSLISITSNYSSLLQWLRDLETNPDFKTCRVEASGFLMQFEKFDTYFKLEMLRQIFTVLEDTSVRLQSEQLNFRLAESIIETLKNVFKSARSESRFKTLWEASISSAKLLELNEPETPRKRKAPSRFESSSSACYYPSTPEEHYCQVYFSVMDGVIVGLSTRFEPTTTTRHLRNVEDFLVGLDGVENVQSFYGNDFEDYSRLTLH